MTVQGSLPASIANIICCARNICDDVGAGESYREVVIAKKPRKKGRVASYKDAGTVLRAARITRGLSQQDVADLLHITRQAYAHYELGNALPPAVDLKTLCELLNVDANVLLGINRSRTVGDETDEGTRPVEGTTAAPLHRSKGS